jgi:16S rRNA (guanine527-N7)-methyltransferase
VAGPDDPALLDALASSQRLGMLGGRPVAEVAEHAMAFVDALAGIPGVVVDLGAGGGVPGLVIAMARPDLRLVLVDRRVARTDHLRRLVRRLQLTDRVEVVAADVTKIDVAADAAVARGFGSPEATLRAAARVVRPGGRIVVSEPPEVDDARWPQALLDRVGVAVVPWRDRRVAVFGVPRETRPRRT